MEENKYYTPEVEEFHVGFEYEMIPSVGFSITDFSNPNQKHGVIWATEYVKGVYGVSDVDSFWGISTINPAIINKKIRVKYLDREDIESLGFEYETTSYGFRYSRNGVFIEYSYDKRLMISFDIGNVGKASLGFIGTIKNKSELKRLMKQLNIL